VARDLVERPLLAAELYRRRGLKPRRQVVLGDRRAAARRYPRYLLLGRLLCCFAAVARIVVAAAGPDG